MRKTFRLALASNRRLHLARATAAAAADDNCLQSLTKVAPQLRRHNSLARLASKLRQRLTRAAAERAANGSDAEQAR